MQLLEKLRKADLTGNEAKVYSVLLRYTGLSGGDIARKARVDRALTYSLLNTLVDKGLASFAIKGTTKRFYAADPSNLLNSVKEKEHHITQLIPELLAIQPQQSHEQTVVVFEGIEGMKSYAKLFVGSKKIYSFGGTGKGGLYSIIKTHAPHLIRILRKQKSKVKILLASPVDQQLVQEWNEPVRVLPASSPVTTVIADDFVGIHAGGDKPFAILMKNTEIVQGYLSYFTFLWKQATPLKKTTRSSSTRSPRAKRRASVQTKRRRVRSRLRVSRSQSSRAHRHT